ncbi:MAG: 1-deoxy-D-xylulose-5-phosphate reductoisomerase, partial [Sulfurovum sp.]
EHILTNPHLGVIVNAANEEAIKAFKSETCTFFGMSEIVLDAYKQFENFRANTIEEIIAIDREVRAYVK